MVRRVVSNGRWFSPRAALGFDERIRLAFGHGLAPVLAVRSWQCGRQLEPASLATTTAAAGMTAGGSDSRARVFSLENFHLHKDIFAVGRRNGHTMQVSLWVPQDVGRPDAIEPGVGLALDGLDTRGIGGFVLADHARAIGGPATADPADAIELKDGAMRASVAFNSSSVSGVSKLRSTMMRGICHLLDFRFSPLRRGFGATVRTGQNNRCCVVDCCARPGVQPIAVPNLLDEASESSLGSGEIAIRADPREQGIGDSNFIVTLDSSRRDERFVRIGLGFLWVSPIEIEPGGVVQGVGEIVSAEGASSWPSRSATVRSSWHRSWAAAYRPRSNSAIESQVTHLYSRHLSPGSRARASARSISPTVLS
jgi:hypothetical protein